MYFPIVLNIATRLVAVIGGGEVAEGKVQSLLAVGARVKVVSPHVTTVLRALADARTIEVINREYVSADIDDAFIVIAATNDNLVQERVWRDAHDRRILVNTVDEPERCDFIMPSVIRRDDLIVAVSTSGKSPAFAAWLQRKLAEWITPEFGRAAALLGSVRKDVRQRFETVAERKRAFQKIIDTDIVTWIRNYDDATAKKRVRTMIEEL
jgi:precorrin-2 dehydrogenase/sirohydrochlorin ferrochelatase